MRALVWTLLVALPALAQTPPAQRTATPVAAPVVATVAPMPATAAKAAPGLEQREIRAQLSPRRYTTLAAEIGAKINHLPVVEGAAFKSGQSLVSFDCSLQQAQLQKAQGALQAAEKVYAGNRRLAEMQSIGKVELDVSEAEVIKNKAEVQSMKAMLAKCHIAAPFAGRVTEQKVREQQFVQPGQALLEIIDDSVLELEFIVPSKWLVWLRTGHAFQVAIDETAKSYPAKVLRIGAKVDPVSQSVKLAAAIDGCFPELIAGMSGRIALAPPHAP